MPFKNDTVRTPQKLWDFFGWIEGKDGDMYIIYAGIRCTRASDNILISGGIVP